MIKWLFFGLALFASLNGSAQRGHLKKAETLIRDLDYQNAIILLERVSQRNPSPQGFALLATCYRLTGRFSDALNAYRQVGEWDYLPAEHALHYGMLLQRAGNCAASLPWLERYARAVPDETRVQNLLKSCDLEADLLTRGQGFYEVSLYPVSTAGSEFSPVWRRGELVFCSDRPIPGPQSGKDAWTGAGFFHLWEVSEALFSQTPQPLAPSLPARFHQASATFSADATELIFTASGWEKARSGKYWNPQLYQTRLNRNGQWDNLLPLPFCDPAHTFAHPCLVPSGDTLFFASDRPGGSGGLDIWYSLRTGDSWSEPTQAGLTCNTAGNEVFPFRQGKNLYFASDGHPGLGGLDIFLLADGQIHNPGAPLNSRDDDFGLVWDTTSTEGFLASNRPGGMGSDDIYRLSRISNVLLVEVLHEKTRRPIPDAEIRLDCTTGLFRTGADGRARIEVPHNACCRLEAGATDFASAQKTRCTYQTPVGSEIFVEMTLQPQPTIRLEGVVFDRSTGLPLENAILVLENDCEGLGRSTRLTDATGRYEFLLSNPCCYTVRASSPGYLPAEVFRQCTQGRERSESLRANLYLQPILYTGSQWRGSNDDGGIFFDPESGQWIDPASGYPANGWYPNGRLFAQGIEQEGVFFEPGMEKPDLYEPIPFRLRIGFQPGKTALIASQSADLDHLLRLLQLNPEWSVEVSVFTPGSDRLAEGRAQSIAFWLEERGMPGERIRLESRGDANADRVEFKVLR